VKLHLSLPSSAEVKNAWIYTPTPSYIFMALYLVRGNFTSASSRNMYRKFLMKLEQNKTEEKHAKERNGTTCYSNKNGGFGKSPLHYTVKN
jgi:hypothetical protein